MQSGRGLPRQCFSQQLVELALLAQLQLPPLVAHERFQLGPAGSAAFFFRSRPRSSRRTCLRSSARSPGRPVCHRFALSSRCSPRADPPGAFRLRFGGRLQGPLPKIRRSSRRGRRPGAPGPRSPSRKRSGALAWVAPSRRCPGRQAAPAAESRLSPARTMNAGLLAATPARAASRGPSSSSYPCLRGKGRGRTTIVTRSTKNGSSCSSSGRRIATPPYSNGQKH
jgi:hypothetical protein